ncbi:MAG: NTP transferase domain-containing protein [Candidatus Limnocylindrales bacterium]
MEQRPYLAALVLAAGAGSRYSDEPGAKLLAPIDGQPMLAGVLDQVRAFGPATTVVVLGHGAAAIEQALVWGDEIRVRNHAPERGLASSLQVGIDALRALPDAFDGAFIVLGDQPLLRAATLRALQAAAASARPADRPAIVPRYDAPGPRNPVLLLRSAWSWVDELEGDEGLGPLLARRPERVLEVAVPGEMPDVDTPDDLAGLTDD